MRTAGINGTFNKDNLAYSISHDWAACLDRGNQRNTPSEFRIQLNETQNNGKLKSNSPYLYNINTGAIIYNFGTFKY